MYKGIAASEGIGTGKAFIIKQHEIIVEEKTVTDPFCELIRLECAKEKFEKDTNEMADQIAIAAGEIEDADISQAPAGAIILAKDLTPSMTAGIVKENICQKVKNTDVICIDGTKIELVCNIAKPV